MTYGNSEINLRDIQSLANLNLWKFLFLYINDVYLNQMLKQSFSKYALMNDYFSFFVIPIIQRLRCNITFSDHIIFRHFSDLIWNFVFMAFILISSFFDNKLLLLLNTFYAFNDQWNSERTQKVILEWIFIKKNYRKIC